MGIESTQEEAVAALLKVLRILVPKSYELLSTHGVEAALHIGLPIVGASVSTTTSFSRNFT
jgi:hypothetical protein